MYDPSETDDLPEDIVSELSQDNGQGRPTTGGMQILQIICDCGGSASTNQIIIGLFKKYGIKVTRTKISSRLSYMRKNGMLMPVQTQGIVSLTESSIEYLANSRKSESQKPAPAAPNNKKDEKATEAPQRKQAQNDHLYILRDSKNFRAGENSLQIRRQSILHARLH